MRGFSAAASWGRLEGRLLAFLAGLAILRLLAIIPIVGGIVWFAATSVGLGALLVATWRARRDYPERAQPAPA